MKRTAVALTSVLLVAFAQSVLAQSAIETALQATVTIEVIGPDGLSHGSGFIVSSDGMIITAAHVIDGATSAVVRLQSGEELNLEGVVTIDGDKDFAIVRVAGFELPTVPLGDADDVSVGERVIVIGSPIDAALAGTISDGLVAASRLMDGIRLIQISAPTSPGNSGGPVLTEQGQVIGLVVSGINAEGAENLNFALPINYVRGQLALATTKPLQPLAEVQVTTRAQADRQARPAPIPRLMDDLVQQGDTYLDRETMRPYSGPVFRFFPNDPTRVEFSANLKGGKLDGLSESYDENGQLGSKGTYVAGELSGPYVRYHQNGQLWQKSTYVAGERDGPYESYHENGQLWHKGTFNMGEACGRWIEYGGETVVTYDPCPPGPSPSVAPS